MDLTVPAFDERDWDRDVDGPLRLAVIGLGWFGRDEALPAIDRSDYCEPAVLVTGSPDDATDLVDRYGVERAITYEEYAEGEATDAYDAVYVATPNALHLDHVEPAAAHGKAVLCEKPLEVTSDRAADVVETCREAGVELMTAYRMHTARSVRWVRELIQSGTIGDPVQVHGEISFDLLAGGDADVWRLDRDVAGGGALMDVGVYPLNTSRFVLDADPIAVSATTRSDREAFDDVEEHVSIQATFPDGVTAAWTASYGGHDANRLAVLGTGGRIVVEPIYGIDADRTITVERDGHETVVSPDEPSELVEEFDYFATAVLGDLAVEPDGADGRFDVDVTEAVYESAASGERVEL